MPVLEAGDAHDKAWRYALAALDAEVRQLAGCGSGDRNMALNEAAFKLGTLLGAGVLSERLVRTALLEACGANGLLGEDGEPACVASLNTGLVAGMALPRDLSEIGQADPR